MTHGRNETQGSFKHDSTSCSSVFMLIYSFTSAVKRQHNYTPLAFRAEETNFLFSLSDSRQRASVFTGLTSCPVQTEENQQTSSRRVPRGDCRGYSRGLFGWFTSNHWNQFVHSRNTLELTCFNLTENEEFISLTSIFAFALWIQVQQKHLFTGRIQL